MQAYRGMDIGTAKPDPGLLAHLPHHLIDILDPDEQYTAGDFVRLADATCDSLYEKGIFPILSGGTGFYLRSFVCGPSSAPQANPALRAKVAADLEIKGPDVLREELFLADPSICQKIKPKDLYRLTRAVEILRATGRPPSEFAPSEMPRPRYEFLILGIERPKEALKERIYARVESMMRKGLAEEVSSLVEKDYGPECPGMKAIGYREFFDLSGESESAIAQAIAMNTLHYAKRQMTFLKALPGIQWIEPDPDLLADRAAAFLSRP
jgi:tRNA dimethylallyltransferase